MNKPTLLLVAALAGCAIFQPTQAAAHDKLPAEGAVLGTFDSRLLALAYYRSEAFAERTAEVRAAHARAQAAGDAEQAARLEREMTDLQELAHRQTFGSAPVPEILALLDGEIAAIAHDAGLQALASRWDLVWQEPDATFPDLSFQLAASFHPDAATLKLMKELASQDPQPAAQMELHPD